MFVNRPLAASTFLFSLLLTTYTHAGHIMVDGAWARATPPMATTGAAYLTLYNHGNKQDRMIDVASPAADSVEIHESVIEKGMASMHRVEALTVPAGGRVEFKPGGYHLMLLGLKHPLKQGKTISLILKFEQAGEITVTVAVKKDGRGGQMNKHEQHEHMHQHDKK